MHTLKVKLIGFAYGLDMNVSERRQVKVNSRGAVDGGWSR
jgi:hypothetical protein